MNLKQIAEDAIQWPLCSDCCKSLGAKPSPWPCTATKETCIKCGKEEWIGAYSDYSWPNGDRAIWD